jgi:glutamate racemase
MARLPADRPIGVFDSGIGGLTVASALLRHLPNESLVYFGDTAHMPYGERSPDAIRYFSLRIANFLMRRQCKLVVIACNSASSAAYNILLDFFEGQALFVNVVDPLVKHVASFGFKKVGVIATKVTVASGVYEQRLKELQPDLEVVSLATPLLAPMIEEGSIHNDVSRAVIQSYLSHPDFEGIDALLLACTHYPLVRDDINAFFGGKVQIFDSTDVVALQAKSLLERNWLLNTDHRDPHRFYVSDLTPSFEDTARMFFGAEVRLEKQDIWMSGM